MDMFRNSFGMMDSFKRNSIIFGSVVGFTSIVIILMTAMNNIRQKERKKLMAKRRRKYRDEQCIRIRDYLATNDENIRLSRRKIMNYKFSELLRNLQSKKVSCVEVLQAYQEKAIEAQEELNCVCLFIEEAKTWVTQLDGMSKEQAETLPLYGVPISIKENFAIKGYDCTIGLCGGLNKTSEVDSAVVKSLKDLGAVPFVITNIPQTLLSFGCSNPIYGDTINPLNKRRSPGGSSGGEGALIRSGGSIMGVGSDVGGSVRIPAAFCGIVSIKPTSQRISSLNARKSLEGLQGVVGVAGLMAQDVSTLTALFRALTESPCSYIHDATLNAIPYNPNNPKILRIGYYEEIESFPVTEPCRRGVRVAVELLESRGFEVKEFKLPKLEDMFKLVWCLLGADEGKQHLEAWKNEVVAESVATSKQILSLPKLLKRYQAYTYSKTSPNIAALIRGYYGMSGKELWNSMAARDSFIQDTIEEWKNNEVDVVISPVLPFPAVLPKNSSILLSSAKYCIIYNFLDFPSGSISVTSVTAEDVQKTKQEYPAHKDQLFSIVAQDIDNDSVGLPVNVQVAALPNREDLILRVLQEIEDAQITF